MKKKSAWGLAVLTLILSAATFSGVANAYQGDVTKEGPNYNPERHEAIEQAFLNNDYQSWQELMNGRGRVSQVINEDNFSKFAEAWKLARSGKVEEAKKLKQELGLLGNHHGHHGNGPGRGNKGRNRNNFVDADNDGYCDNYNQK